MLTAIVASVTLVVYALIDCARTSPADIRRLTRRAWLSLILAVPVLGAVAWLILGRPRHHGHRPVPARSHAPDDDEDFLRALDGDDAAYRRRLEDWERDLRRRERELRRGADPDDPGEAEGDHPGHPDDPDDPDGPNHPDDPDDPDGGGGQPVRRG